MVELRNVQETINYNETDDDIKILYIDDCQAHLDLIEQIIIQHENRLFFGTKSPRVGIEWALENKPDLILLDIHMPEMDGFQILKTIKSSHLKSVPVVAISACAMPMQVTKGLKSGFDEYITKPFDITYFNNKLSQILKIQTMHCNHKVIG